MLEEKNISVVEDNTEVKVNFVLPGFMRSCQEYRQIGSFTDVAIHCLHPDSGDVTIYSAHSLLLSASSTCFSYILEKALSQLSQLHIHSLKKHLQVIQNSDPYEAYFLSKEENVLTFEVPRCYKEDAAKDGEDDFFGCFNSGVTDDAAKPSLSPVKGIDGSSDSKKPIVVTLTSFNTLNNVILVLKGLEPMYFKYVLYCVYSQSFSIKKENINLFLCIIRSFKLTNCRNLANLLQCFISDEGKGIPNEALSMSYKLDTTEKKTGESPHAFKPFLKDHETFSVLNAEFDTIQRKSVFIPSLSSSLMPLDLSTKHGDLIKSNGGTSNGMEIVDKGSSASNVWSPPTKGSSHIEVSSLACQSSNVLKKIDSNVVYNTLDKSLSYPYMSSLFGENGSALKTCEEVSEVEKSEQSEENLSLERSELSTLIKCKEVILERPLKSIDARKWCPEDASSRSIQNVIMHEKKRSADSTCQRVLAHTKESVNAKKLKYSHKQSVLSKCDSPHVRYAVPSSNASDGLETKANHAHNGLTHLPSMQDDSLLKLKNNSSIRIQRLPRLSVPKKMKSNKRNLELEFTKVFPSDRSKKAKYEGDAELSKMPSVKTASTDSNGGQSCIIVCERKPQRKDQNKLVYTSSATEEDVWKGKRIERNADENIYGEVPKTINEETSDGESDGSSNLETGKTNNNETDISNGAEIELTIIKTNKPINEETSEANQEPNKTNLKTSKTNEEREKLVDEEKDSINIETGKETETIKCYACEFDAPKFSDVICHIKEHHLTRDLKMSHCIDPKCPVQLLFCSNEWEKHIEHHIIKFSYECTECTYSTKTSIGIMRHEMTHRTTRKRILLPIKKVGPKGRPPSAGGKRKPPFRTQPTPCRKTGKAGNKKNKKKAQPAKRVPKKKRRMGAQSPAGQDELTLEDVCRSRVLVGLVKGICLKEQRGHAGFKRCFAVLTSSHFFEAGFGSEDEPRRGPSDSDDKDGEGGGATEGQPLEEIASPPPPNDDAETPSRSPVPSSATQKILTRKVRFTSKKKKRKPFNCRLCETVLSSKESLASHYHNFHRLVLPFTSPFDGCDERLEEEASHLYVHGSTHPKSSSSPSSSCLEAASPVRRDLDHQETLTTPRGSQVLKLVITGQNLLKCPTVQSLTCCLEKETDLVLGRERNVLEMDSILIKQINNVTFNSIKQVYFPSVNSEHAYCVYEEVKQPDVNPNNFTSASVLKVSQSPINMLLSSPYNANIQPDLDQTSLLSSIPNNLNYPSTSKTVNLYAQPPCNQNKTHTELNSGHPPTSTMVHPQTSSPVYPKISTPVYPKISTLEYPKISIPEYPKTYTLVYPKLPTPIHPKISPPVQLPTSPPVHPSPARPPISTSGPEHPPASPPVNSPGPSGAAVHHFGDFYSPWIAPPPVLVFRRVSAAEDASPGSPCPSDDLRLKFFFQWMLAKATSSSSSMDFRIPLN